MPDALVGHTGFVGGHLAMKHKFDSHYNSKNIEEIAGNTFDLLIISAMPAAMWIANRDPEADRAALDRLVRCLQQVRAKRVLVMSTVAVYPSPNGVDEDSPIDEVRQTPYGRHRLLLERLVEEHFPKVCSVRLPALFGSGLKKNAVYDLLHNNELNKVNSNSVYQFYNLERLWDDVNSAFNAGLKRVNFATEPLSIREIAQDAFQMQFSNNPGNLPANYDMRTKYANLFGGENGYIYDREQVLDELRVFVAQERIMGATG